MRERGLRFGQHFANMLKQRRPQPGDKWYMDEVFIRIDGIHGRPIVFYCLADCWMSWNATKRAAGWGYTNLYWCRDGIDAWEAARLPTADAEPVSGIVTARKPR